MILSALQKELEKSLASQNAWSQVEISKRESIYKVIACVVSGVPVSISESVNGILTITTTPVKFHDGVIYYRPIENQSQ